MASGTESESESTANTLPIIRYKRDSMELEVLDQHKLPQEIVYIKVVHAADAWMAIRFFLGRGMPAIAVVLALSMAFIVERRKTSTETSAEAAAIFDQFSHYLLSSQPTELNISYLSETVKKLNEIASNAVASGKAPKDVYQACIDRAYAMLDTDAATNKTIAFVGASFIHFQQKHTNQVCVLTQLNNIGSLASAEYGTVYGIIPALHGLGALNMAYYTDTNPFYQDSNFSAFKQLQDKFPATLLADSAAAFVMREKCVNAVLVAVDCIAGNGDCANKIGTYGLAYCAKCHGIPFYVAAPVACIDFSCSTGIEFGMDMGALGELATESNISVWNPVTDVTPYQLIDGIITDRGAVTKTVDNVFELKSLIEDDAADWEENILVSKSRLLSI